MSVTAEKTVGELGVEIPGATRIFERAGIDYCCGGGKTLEEACTAAHLPAGPLMESLEAAGRAGQVSPDQRDWQAETLSELIAHIRSTHHKYTREEMARLGPLFDKVCAVHGKNHTELVGLRATFSGLVQELTTHMMKEEMVLFPYVVRMEEAAIEKAPLVPAPFGTVRNPVAMMLHEHDDAGAALRTLRQVSNDFRAPADACISYRTLYQALAEFEADLHQHIHLENNILFPRAVKMEQTR